MKQILAVAVFAFSVTWCVRVTGTSPLVVSLSNHELARPSTSSGRAIFRFNGSGHIWFAVIASARMASIAK